MAGAIDCHAHFIPPELIRALERRAHPSIDVDVRDVGIRFQFPALDPSPPAPEAITDIRTTIQWMDERGITVQIVSPWTDIFGYTLRQNDAVKWSRSVNEALLGTLADAGPRLHAFATVPLEYPSVAAEELEWAAGAGCRGVMIGTHAPSVELDDERLQPFWETAEALALPVFVHPIFLRRDPRMEIFGLHNAVGRANETNLAISRLLFAGVLERHPRLAVIVAHGGAGLSLLLPRLARNREVFAAEAADPRVAFSRLYFDTIVGDARTLGILSETAGTERLVLGSDYPFPWEPDPRAVVEKAFGDAAGAVLSGNAERLFRLEL